MPKGSTKILHTSYAIGGGKYGCGILGTHSLTLNDHDLTDYVVAGCDTLYLSSDSLLTWQILPVSMMTLAYSDLETI